METTSPRWWNLVVRAGLVLATASACDGANPRPTPNQMVRARGGSSNGDAGSAAGGSETSGTGGGLGAGTSSTGGASGEGSDAGDTGASGGTHSGTQEICRFEIAAKLGAIPTVGVVDWSTDLAGLSEAHIEFTLDEPLDDELNRGSSGAIDVSGTTHRALMLGLKPERTYTYRIVATGGDEVCTSADHSLATGSSPGAPTVTRTVENAAAQARGFIVTSGGFPGAVQAAYVIDADGDVVWWAPSPKECSRALLDWEGANLWMVATNPAGVNAGALSRIGMDGEGAVSGIEALSNAHHDIAVVPGGIVAALVWNVDGSQSSDLVERSPDGTLRTVVRIGEDLFESQTSSEDFHPNAIQYHPADDTYTVSDLNARAIVKVTRQGKPIWQIGGECEEAAAPKCASIELSGNHGHHLLDNGNLLYFQATSAQSIVHELELTETPSSLTVNEVWSYSDPLQSSLVLGDVQRLPNGNTLVVYSTDGVMHEVSEAGEIVQTLKADAPDGTSLYTDFGYANFRETLYGPPLR